MSFYDEKDEIRLLMPSRKIRVDVNENFLDELENSLIDYKLN